MMHDAWCVTPDTQIVYGKTYTGVELSLADAAGYVLKPQNLDLVLWVINQKYVGKPSQAGGNFTLGDVQNAIWLLIDDSLSVDQGPYSMPGCRRSSPRPWPTAKATPSPLAAAST